MRTLALASLLALVAACRIKGDPATDAAAATCAPVSHTCSTHADCCSFACVQGLCVANTQPGGICRSSDDCTYTMACDAGQCRPGLVCLPTFGDVCTSNNQCCSGNCLGENSAVYPPTAGTCGTETAPIVELGGPYTAPYYATTVLRATVTDPDPEDVFYYAWDVVSAPTGALTGWTSSAAAPSVFLSAKGTYTLRVRVADGPSTQRNRFTATDTVTITAVNLPPVVSADPSGLPSTALRNTPITLVGAVSDPNGAATPVSCAWYARPPGQAELATPVASWASCPASPAASFTTPIAGPEGVWEFRLEASDGELTTSAVRAVDVVNAAPVALACAYECQTPPAGGVPSLRVGNLGAPGQTAPSVPLHGSATDANGDVGTAGFSWAWTLVSAPSGSTAAAVRGSGAGTAPPLDGALDPDVAGTYVVQLHVADGWGGAADATVAVRVDPYLRPLYPVDGGTGLPFGGDVPDAAYAHATDRIVFIGAEESSAVPRVWQLDPEASPTSAIPSANLAYAGVALAVDPTGTSGIVGESAYFERVSLSGAPSTSGASNAIWLGFTPNAVLDAGSREYALSPGGQVYDISSANSSPGIATCNAGSTCAGTRGAAADGVLWLLDEATGLVRRYTVQPSGKLDQTAAATGLGAASAIWGSAAYGGAQDVVDSTGARYADTLTALTAASPSLPFALRHLDTTAVASQIQGVAVASSGAEVRTVSAGWQAPASNALALPAVGYLGTGYPTTARYAFVRTDGSRSYVILRVFVAGKYRWYLMKY